MAKSSVETQVFSTININAEELLRQEVDEGLKNWSRGQVEEIKEKVFEESKKQLTNYLDRYGAQIDYDLNIVEWHKESEFVISANNARYFSVNNKLEISLYDENPNGLYEEISKFDKWAENLVKSAIETAVFYCVVGAREN